MGAGTRTGVVPIESCVRWRSLARVRSAVAASCEVWRRVAISRPKHVHRTTTQPARAATPCFVMPNTRKLITLGNARCSPENRCCKEKTFWVCFVKLTVICGTSVKASHTPAYFGFEPRSATRRAISPSPPCVRPSSTPFRSIADWFWLTFHLPSNDARGISIPTIARIRPPM